MVNSPLKGFFLKTFSFWPSYSLSSLKLPEVKIERRHVIGLAGLPISVGHGDLESHIQVDGGGGGGGRERLTW